MQWRTIIKALVIVAAITATPDIFRFVRTQTRPLKSLGSLYEANDAIKAFAKDHPHEAEVRAYLEEAGFSCKKWAFSELGQWQKDRAIRLFKTETSKVNCRYRLSILGDAWVIAFDHDGAGKVVYVYAGVGDVFK